MFIQVIVSDGDLSTLENMKLNLDLNKLQSERTAVSQRLNETVSVSSYHVSSNEFSFFCLYCFDFDKIADSLAG